MEEKYPNIRIHVYAVRNDFFGERITVSGLVTAQDIMAQLQEKSWENGFCSHAIC